MLKTNDKNPRAKSSTGIPKGNLLPGLGQVNWFHLHHQDFSTLSTKISNTFSNRWIKLKERCKNVWKSNCNPFTLNCGIGDHKIKMICGESIVLSSVILKSIILLCGTKFLQQDSSEDMKYGMIEIRKVLEKNCNFLKNENPTQVFSCELCESFKSTFFYRTLSVAASGPISLLLIISKVAERVVHDLSYAFISKK